MKNKYTLQIWEHRAGLQLCTDFDNRGGYRLSGPKFDGTSKLAREVEISPEAFYALHSVIELDGKQDAERTPPIPRTETPGLCYLSHY